MRIVRLELLLASLSADTMKAPHGLSLGIPSRAPYGIVQWSRGVSERSFGSEKSFGSERSSSRGCARYSHVESQMNQQKMPTGRFSASLENGPCIYRKC